MCPCSHADRYVCGSCAREIEVVSRVMSRWLLSRTIARWKCEAVLGADYFLD